MSKAKSLMSWHSPEMAKSVQEIVEQLDGKLLWAKVGDKEFGENPVPEVSVDLLKELENKKIDNEWAKFLVEIKRADKVRHNKAVARRKKGK